MTTTEMDRTILLSPRRAARMRTSGRGATIKQARVVRLDRPTAIAYQQCLHDLVEAREHIPVTEAYSPSAVTVDYDRGMIRIRSPKDLVHLSTEQLDDLQASICELLEKHYDWNQWESP